MADVLLHIENGADLNLRETPYGLREDQYWRSGAGTLLGNAVRLNCVEAVRLLLEHGADPNIHSGSLTPLLSNLLLLSETADIKDEVLREQTRAPMREIRALLLSHGAYCDGTPLHRRWFIDEFREFLSPTNGHTLYVFCTTNTITIDDHNSLQRFEVPVSDGTELSGHDLRPALADVIEAQSTIADVNIRIIGVRDVALSVGSLYREQGIPETTFPIPDHLVADPKTLTDLFLSHPDSYTSDIMRMLDEISPQRGRINPISHMEAELLAL